MCVDVKRACVYGTDSQRIEWIVLKNRKHPAYSCNTMQLTQPQDVLIMVNVVKNACREGDVERIVWNGNVVILNLHSRSYPGKALRRNLKAARRNVRARQLSAGEIPSEVWRRVAYARAEIQNALSPNIALPCQPGESFYLVLMEKFRTFSGHSYGLSKQLIVLVGKAIEFGRVHGKSF